MTAGKNVIFARMMMTLYQHLHYRWPACLLGLLAMPLSALDSSPGHKVFQQPDPQLSTGQQLDFFVGQSFAQKPWVIAPSTTTSRDGLGPLYNASSCIDCHHGNGKAALLDDTELHTRVVHTGGPQPSRQTKQLGRQLQTRAIPGIKPEAHVSLSYTTFRQSFADGSVIELRQPQLHIGKTLLAWTSAEPLSLRTPGILAGMGLLEAIADQTLLALADPDDHDGDGISGRVNHVPDIATNTMAIGRFGWKAGQPSLRQQVASAFAHDIGITSTVFMAQPCTSVQQDCLQAHHGGIPEIDDTLLAKVTFYISALAVPSARPSANADKGRKVFMQAGCAACHIPQLPTSSHAPAPFANRIIHAYTDLLLHDMGEALADHRPEFAATGHEWRTPPLWGLGWAEKTGVPVGYLHDSRARTLMEAIVWHGGEAEPARQAVLSLPAKQREWLVEFLQSL